MMASSLDVDSMMTQKLDTNGGDSIDFNKEGGGQCLTNQSI